MSVGWILGLVVSNFDLQISYNDVVLPEMSNLWLQTIFFQCAYEHMDWMTLVNFITRFVETTTYYCSLSSWVEPTWLL
jgi:hypothetical protein